MTTNPRPDLDPTKGYLTSLTLESIRCFGSPAETEPFLRYGPRSYHPRSTDLITP